MELASHICDWPTQYHLSPSRSNLLRPVQNLLRGKILEAGSGCGAITRFLGETGAEVLALEGSAFRARINASRSRDQENVISVADAFHQLNPAPIFDVVTLIGVLEYAPVFFPNSENGDSTDAMLTHARRFLKPGGVVIIAIENQLGLKYFSGFAEDHKGVVGYGIEDQYTKSEAATFGRTELSQRIAGSGLAHQKWLFPYPDYKFAQLVLNEHSLDDSGIDLSAAIAQALIGDPQTPFNPLFSQEKLLGPVLRNQLAGHLANSFLVVASDQSKPDSPKEDSVIAYGYATMRRPCFAKKTIFTANKVSRDFLWPKSLTPPDLSFTLHLDNEPFYEGDNWRQELIRIVNRPGWTLSELIVWFQTWFDALIDKTGLSKSQLSAKTQISGSLFDALPRNLILSKEGKAQWIDQEWRMERSIELGFMVFRVVFEEFNAIDSVAAPASRKALTRMDIYNSLASSIDISINNTSIMRYIDQENAFHNEVTGIPHTVSFRKIFKRKLNVRKRSTSFREKMHHFRQILVYCYHHHIKRLAP
jgi:2-polyprenyl-3-methyl-5-hydroxy-6-metoxy-1,4-benzoquinol methylase